MKKIHKRTVVLNSNGHRLLHRIIVNKRVKGFTDFYASYPARMNGCDVFVGKSNIGYVNNLNPLPCRVYAELIEREIVGEPDAHFYLVLEAEEETDD